MLFEGLNFDGRTAEQEKDENHLVPLTRVIQLRWKYEPAPPGFNEPAPAATTPAAATTKAPAKPPAARQPMRRRRQAGEVGDSE